MQKEANCVDCEANGKVAVSTLSWKFIRTEVVGIYILN